MALFLPCKHWFHENCVVMWLKEHNTCPICRTPIEKNDGGENNEHRDGPQSGMPRNNPGGPGASFSGAFPDSSADGGSGSSQPGTSRWFSASFGGSQRGVGAAGDNNSSGSILHPTQSSRPPSHRHSRLNEALRSVSSMQERQREREREQGSSSSVSYDTSRMQRRNSMSPTSPRGTAPGEYGSRIRHRSPSQSSGRWEASDSESSQSQRQSGHGPLSWIRDRFGGGGSNNNSSRGGRRP